MTFSKDAIRELLQNSDRLMKALQDAYTRLPSTRCRRRTHCCSILPEMTLLEAVAGIRQVMGMSSAVRKRLNKKIIRYFFLNPTEITSCPFLDDTNCLIYNHRFFGCRAYGLWSPAYYERLAQQNRRSKKQLQKQWTNLGVLLPRAVVDFQVPYCPHVETVGPTPIDDEELLQVADSISAASTGFSSWHQLFGQRYFSDFSFLLATLVFGYPEAIQMKFSIVSNILNTGNRAKLDRVLQGLHDLFADLT